MPQKTLRTYTVNSVNLQKTKLIAALFIITTIWKQCKCPVIDEWVDGCLFVCVCRKIYSKKNKVGGLKLSDFNPTANYSNQDSCYSSSTDITINIWSIYFLKVTKEN